MKIRMACHCEVTPKNMGLLRRSLYSLLAMTIGLLSIFFQITVYAAFEEAPSGARALALSRTFAARTDTVYSIFFNPAGIAFLQRPQFAAEYQRNLMGLDDGSNINSSNALFAAPINMQAPRAAGLKTLFTVGAGYQSLALADAYSENITQITFGVPVTKIAAAGISLKSLQQKYIFASNPYYTDDAVFLKGDGSSVTDADYGIIIKPLNNISAGFSSSNFMMKKYGISEMVGLESSQRLGILYSEESFNIAVELQRRNYSDGSQTTGYLSREKMKYSAAIEKMLVKKDDGYMLALRTGFNWSGAQDVKNITAGIGINTGRFEIDYGWSFPLSGIEDTSGSNSFSLQLKFGKITVTSKPARTKGKLLKDSSGIAVSSSPTAPSGGYLLKSSGIMAPATPGVSVPAPAGVPGGMPSGTSGAAGIPALSSATASQPASAPTQVNPVTPIISTAVPQGISEKSPVIKSTTAVSGITPLKKMALPGIMAPSTSALTMPQMGTGAMPEPPSVSISSVPLDNKLQAPGEMKSPAPASAASAPGLPAVPSAGGLPSLPGGPALMPSLSLPLSTGGSEPQKTEGETGTEGGQPHAQPEGANAQSIPANAPGETGAAQPSGTEVIPPASSGETGAAIIPGVTVEKPVSAEKPVQAGKKPVKTAHGKGAPVKGQPLTINAKPFTSPEIVPTPVKVYRAQAGETLLSIAQKFYGDSGKWVKIYEANKDRIEKGIVKPGQKLIIP